MQCNIAISESTVGSVLLCIFRFYTAKIKTFFEYSKLSSKKPSGRRVTARGGMREITQKVLRPEGAKCGLRNPLCQNLVHDTGCDGRTFCNYDPRLVRRTGR